MLAAKAPQLWDIIVSYDEPLKDTPDEVSPEPAPVLLVLSEPIDVVPVGIEKLPRPTSGTAGITCSGTPFIVTGAGDAPAATLAPTNKAAVSTRGTQVAESARRLHGAGRS